MLTGSMAYNINQVDSRHSFSRPSGSSNGCWTCRLRRKRCDENPTICNTCAKLHITCHYDHDKPEWMDGGARQAEMAEQLRNEVKDSAHHRREERALLASKDSLSSVEAVAHQSTLQPTIPPPSFAQSRIHVIQHTPNDAEEPCRKASSNEQPQHGHQCTLITQNTGIHATSERSDAVLTTFYLDHVFPFLFSFYRPSPLQGGRSWILETITTSPVIRHAALSQSSYFFSLVQRKTRDEGLWEVVLNQTRDAFEVLRQSLRIIDGADITDHLHGTVRIMAGIMQMQRFEIAVLSFDNCQAHLNAALALFEQLLQSSDNLEPTQHRSSFNSVLDRLGPPQSITPRKCTNLPNAEQAAFRFSSTLLMFEDIIASTVLQEQPKLYDYHHDLLDITDTCQPVINFDAIVGCQNWVILCISEIAALDAWKCQCKRNGNLDVMELVCRAATIKETLETRLA